MLHLYTAQLASKFQARKVTQTPPRCVLTPCCTPNLQDPVALLRGSPRVTGIARYWPYSAAAHPTELTAEEVAPYSALLAASQPLIAQEVLDS